MCKFWLCLLASAYLLQGWHLLSCCFGARRFYTPYEINGPMLHILTVHGMLLIFDSNWPTLKHCIACLVSPNFKIVIENYNSEEHRLQYFEIKKWANVSFHRHFYAFFFLHKGDERNKSCVPPRITKWTIHGLWYDNSFATVVFL